MQNKVALLLLSISMLLFSGCLEQDAAEPAPDDLYREAAVAMSESNSCLYQANVVWSDGDLIVQKNVKGKATLTPTAYQKETKTQVDSITFGLSMASSEGGKYLVDGIVYTELAETTWVITEENDHRNYLLPDEDPFGHILFLKGSSLKDAQTSRSDESYILHFNENSPELNEMLEEKLEEWLYAIYFEYIFYDGDALGSLVVSEAEYELVVDSDTYLPQSVGLSFKADFQLGGNQEQLEYNAFFNFLEYGIIENISVPGEITELAFPASAVGRTDPDQPLQAFKGKNFNFTIDYPLHWRYEISNDICGAVVFRGPQATIDYHIFLQVISLASVRIDGFYANLDDVFDMVQGHYASIGGELIGYEESLPFYIEDATYDMLFAAYVCTYENADGFFSGNEYVDYREYVMIVDGEDDYYYLITFASPAAVIDDYIQLADAILDTFRLETRE